MSLAIKHNTLYGHDTSQHKAESGVNIIAIDAGVNDTLNLINRRWLGIVTIGLFIATYHLVCIFNDYHD